MGRPACAVASTIRDSPRGRSALWGRAPVHFQVCLCPHICGEFLSKDLSFNAKRQKGNGSGFGRSVIFVTNGVRTTVSRIGDECATHYTKRATLFQSQTGRYEWTVITAKNAR